MPESGFNLLSGVIYIDRDLILQNFKDVFSLRR